MRLFRPCRTKSAMFILIGATVAAVAVVTPGAAAPAPAPRVVGAIESATMYAATHVVTLSGWVEDLTQTAASPIVTVWIDGRYVRVVAVNVSRPDINAARKITGRHGYRIRLLWGVAARTVTIRTPDAGHRIISSRTLRKVQVVVPPGTRIVIEAKKYLGLHNPGYVHGGTSPVTGFDCSGYTSYLYRVTRVANLVAYTETQRRTVRLIPASQARPGDLVFYMSGGSSYHVAIYAGNGMQYAAATEWDGIVYQHVWSSAVQYGTTWH